MKNALLAIFGPDSKEVIYSGDAVQDKNAAAAFVAGYGVMHRWRKMPDGPESFWWELTISPFRFHLRRMAKGSGSSIRLRARMRFGIAVLDGMNWHRVVTHLHFTGHFTGSFMGKAGQSQKVDFIATAVYRISDGRIAEDWHLEDNQTFLQQIRFVAH